MKFQITMQCYIIVIHVLELVTYRRKHTTSVMHVPELVLGDSRHTICRLALFNGSVSTVFLSIYMYIDLRLYKC